MRSAYPAVFFCALACASVPSTSTARLSATGPASAAPSLPVSTESAPTRGAFITGSFTTEYFSGETVLDVLRRRAPLYLRARPNPSAELSATGPDPIAVYIDGSYSGDLDVLQLIPAHEVVSVNRISATEAAIRFGPKRNSGALLVTLVKHE